MTEKAIVRTRFMTGILAGLLVAAGIAGGIYAAASAAASTLAASFVTAETTSDTRIAETHIAGIATKTKRAAAEHRAARAKCERLAGEDRFVCRSEARAEMKRAVLRSAAR